MTKSYDYPTPGQWRWWRRDRPVALRPGGAGRCTIVKVTEVQLYELFSCPYVLESEHCAVIRTPADGYAFGRFRYPRRAFEKIATYTQMAAAKRAFDAYNQAMSGWRKAA